MWQQCSWQWKCPRRNFNERHSNRDKIFRPLTVRLLVSKYHLAVPPLLRILLLNACFWGARLKKYLRKNSLRDSYLIPVCSIHHAFSTRSAQNLILSNFVRQLSGLPYNRGRNIALCVFNKTRTNKRETIRSMARSKMEMNARCIHCNKKNLNCYWDLFMPDVIPIYQSN